MLIQNRLLAPRTLATWHGFQKENLCVPWWTNEQQASLLRPRCLDGRSGLQMAQLESLQEPNQHQQCNFFSDSAGLHDSQIRQSWMGKHANIPIL